MCSMKRYCAKLPPMKAKMKIAILSTFPDMFRVFDDSILGRAQKNDLLQFDLVNIRDFSQNKHKNTDDYPYGGGAGMLMMAQPIFDSLAHVKSLGYRGKKIYMGPKGRRLDQRLVEELAQEPDLCLLCGHYEGVDQRALDAMDMEVSIGDYILTGGELAAMVLVDAVARLLPGVLGAVESAQDESFSSGLLEYPQYTRPADYKGMLVPEVLLNGNHAHIAQWRREQALLATYRCRPDLLQTASLSKDDLDYLKSLEQANERV